VKQITGYISRKELGQYESGECVTLLVTRSGNIIETDDRIPVKLTVDEIPDLFREYLNAIAAGPETLRRLRETNND
jgi:hypothetical protein